MLVQIHEGQDLSFKGEILVTFKSGTTRTKTT
jgi:hypothetical protein